MLDGGDFSVVVNSSYNNGVGGMTTQRATEDGSIITFSDTVDANTIFYQDTPFVGYAHVQGLYPIGKYKNAWSKQTLQFFVSVFRKKALSMGFDYGNKFRRDVASDLVVKLPVDSNGKPDWKYMEKYMQNMEVKVGQILREVMNNLKTSLTALCQKMMLRKPIRT